MSTTYKLADIDGQLWTMDIHAKLLCAATEYDRAQSKRKGYNPYALGHYARGLNRIRQRADIGQPLRESILSEFSGRLCDRLLRAVGLDLMTDSEARRGLYPPLPELPDDE